MNENSGTGIHMYKVVELEDIVRIPPERLGGDVTTMIEEESHTAFEGVMIKDIGLITSVNDVSMVGEGKIIYNNAGIYQRVKFKALTFMPQLHEIVEGQICEVTAFGAFMRFGPLDGLIHVSQITDDFMNFDEKNQRLSGKSSKNSIAVGDVVRARIVSLSPNFIHPRDSKIGLTMRQPGLGKLEWLEGAAKKEEEKVKEKVAAAAAVASGKAEEKIEEKPKKTRRRRRKKAAEIKSK